MHTEYNLFREQYFEGHRDYVYRDRAKFLSRVTTLHRALFLRACYSRSLFFSTQFLFTRTASTV